MEAEAYCSIFGHNDSDEVTEQTELIVFNEPKTKSDSTVLFT